MIDSPRPIGGDDFELRRTLLMRAVGGPLFQGLLLFFVLVGLGTSPSSPQPLANLGAGVVALLLWLPGPFASVRVDDVGIHRRCYRSSTDRWSDISKVELRIQALGRRGARPVIRIHDGRHHHLLTPACGLNRATDEFAHHLLVAATRRGIAVDSQAWEPRLSRRYPES